MNKITTNEAAKIAGISPELVRQWIRAGKLSGFVHREPVGFFKHRYMIEEKPFREWLQKVS